MLLNFQVRCYNNKKRQKAYILLIFTRSLFFQVVYEKLKIAFNLKAQPTLILSFLQLTNIFY